MESFIIYLVIALFAIISGIKNYKKEKAKNKQRAKEILSQPIPTIKPFQKKDKKQTPTTPTPVILTKYDSLEEDTIEKNFRQEDQQTTIEKEDTLQNISTTNKNPYNNKDIANILARVEEYSDANEKAAFFIESEDITNNNQENRSVDLQLNTSEDYKRAFIYTLIFDRKY